MKEILREEQQNKVTIISVQELLMRNANIFGPEYAVFFGAGRGGEALRLLQNNGPRLGGITIGG